MATRRPGEPLWLTEPTRKTCLATVTAVEGEWFMVDRRLFSAGRSACRHPQPADKGTVWRGGEKRKLAKVRTDGWYRLRDVVPEVDEELRCELDQDWRDALARAHTAMHFFLAASDAPLTADPETKGGGHARLTFGETLAPKRLAGWLDQARQWVADDLPLTTRFVPHAEAQRFATTQSFQPPDPLPGPDPVPLVEIPGVCTYPCDGTHVDRTGRIEDLVVSHAAWGKDGFVVGLRAR